MAAIERTDAYPLTHRKGAGKTEGALDAMLWVTHGPPASVVSVLTSLDQLPTRSGSDGLSKRHQPLTLLWAIGQARHHHLRLTTWPVARMQIGDLLAAYGRETDRRNPDRPFLALDGTDLWELDQHPPRGEGRRIWLNNAKPFVRGGLTLPVYNLVVSSDEAAVQIINKLLTTYFDHEVDEPALLRAVHLDDLSEDLASARQQQPADARSDEPAPTTVQLSSVDGLPQADAAELDAGYTADAVLRRALEMHAVARATQCYQAEGYIVTDVGGTESYDLHAVKDSVELHVEVKGSTGQADTVELTRNEVHHAHGVRTDLVVVDQIAYERLPDGSVTTADGRLRRWRAWIPAEEALQPSRYRYRLPELG